MAVCAPTVTAAPWMPSFVFASTTVTATALMAGFAMSIVFGVAFPSLSTVTGTVTTFPSFSTVTVPAVGAGTSGTIALPS